MSKITRSLLGRYSLSVVLIATLILGAGIGTATYVLAATSTISTFNQTIGAGTLATAIVDSAYAEVGSPSIAMSSQTFSFSCLTSTGTFGVDAQRVYVQNPDAADGGWILNLSGTTTTTTWSDGGSNTFDFNDPAGGTPGCTNGQMTVNPSGASLSVGACATCAITNVSKGDSEAFNQGVNDDVDLMTGASTSDDIGDWYLTSISISQKVPGEKAATAYSIVMKLTVSTI